MNAYIPSRGLGILLALVVGLSTSACREAEPTVTAEPGYALTGEIVKVDPERGTLLVNHDEIPDYMPAMVMEFKVSAGDLANAGAGQRIRARMIPEDGGTFRLERLWTVDPVADATVAAAAGALSQDTTIRGNRAYREVGESLPDFALYDQSGAVVSPTRFRGKHIVLNFIFTRCPVATMCPAATERMVALQQAARARGIDDLELISITLDPVYDTPGVLREYAQVRGIDTSNFSFLTGPERAIKDLLRQFGVIAEFEGSLLQHTLATLLIDPSGRIVYRADGSMWDVEEFVERMER